MRDVDLVNEKWELDKPVSSETSFKLVVLLNFIGIEESMYGEDYNPCHFMRSARKGLFLRTRHQVKRKDHFLISYEELMYNIKRTIYEQAGDKEDSHTFD